jgi:uncharacterized metal-binding protein
MKDTISFYQNNGYETPVEVSVRISRFLQILLLSQKQATETEDPVLYCIQYIHKNISSQISVKDLAEKLKQILEKENLSVFLVNCKESKLEASELSENMSGLSCDPKAQAEYLNEQETDFNINFGLCLGHGMLFQKYSKAPTTTLLVKDACHKHNITENFL